MQFPCRPEEEGDLMAVQVEEVRELVDFEPEGFLVTSFYLNVDAADFPSDDLLATSFESLIHMAEEQRKPIEESLSHDATESLRNDLGKIRDWFHSGIDRQDTKSVGIFSCSALDFWEVVPMPTPVDSQVTFNPKPHISPIATFVSHTKPTAILVTDKQNARIFTMKGSEIREWTSFEDFVPQRSSQGGWSQMRYQRRSDNFRRHHIDHATELTLKLLQNYPFDWLILGAEVQTKADLEASLHPYLKDRVVGEINVRIDADASEIVAKAAELREEIESQHIDKLVEQIREFAGAGGRGSIGIKDTIQALNEQKIHILLVQEQFQHPGAECPACGLLMPSQRDTCPACNAPARPVENAVDSMIQKALELGSTVEIALESDKLESIQCVGAILYY
jgi:peptide chain release factor subunit 1